MEPFHWIRKPRLKMELVASTGSYSSFSTEEEKLEPPSYWLVGVTPPTLMGVVRSKTCLPLVVKSGVCYELIGVACWDMPGVVWG